MYVCKVTKLAKQKHTTLSLQILLGVSLVSTFIDKFRLVDYVILLHATVLGMTLKGLVKSIIFNFLKSKTFLKILFALIPVNKDLECVHNPVNKDLERVHI